MKYHNSCFTEVFEHEPFHDPDLEQKINLHSQKKIRNCYGNKPRKKITNNLVCVVTVHFQL